MITTSINQHHNFHFIKNLSSLSLTAFLILISLCTGQSQVTNGDRYNVNVWTDRFSFQHSDSPWNPSFVMGIREDDDDSPTLLVSPNGGPANGNSTYHDQTYTTAQFFNSAKNIYSRFGIHSPKFDFTVVSFNWRDNNHNSLSDYYQPQFEDKNPGRYATLQDVTDEAPSQWYTRWHNGVAVTGNVTELRDAAALRSVRLEMTWRFHHGDGLYESASRTGALEFGTLGMGDKKYHVNSNRRRPTGGHSALGYLNQWTSSSPGINFSEIRSSPDVTYSFVIEENADVIISTDYPETNFDTRIHLVKADPTMSTHGELLQSGLDISDDNTKSALVQNLEPGQYWIVVEGNQDNAAGAGDFKLSVAVVSGFADQGIANQNSYVKSNGTFICPLTSLSTPSSSDTIIYQWQTKPSAAGDEAWTDVFEGTDELLSGIGINPSLPLDIRRIITSAGITLYTNSLRFDGIAGTSVINGKVTGPTTSGSQGIEGVWVYATPISPVDEKCSIEADSAITNIDGEYTLKNIVYPDGEFVDYNIYPAYLDHDFTPDTITNVTVGNGLNPTVQTFIDNTVLFISGKVEQDSAGLLCGLPDVSVSLVGLTTTTLTDSLGNYTLPAQVGNFDVEAFYVDDTHLFTPPIYENVVVTDDVTNINFESTTTHTIAGSVTTCEGNCLGKVEIQLEDVGQETCFVFKTITDNCGNFSIDVPGREYIVSITTDNDDLNTGYDIQAISQFFSDTIFANVAVADTVYHFEYRQEPFVNIQSATDSTGFQTIGTCSQDIVLGQGELTTIIFDITEDMNYHCALDTGILVVIDEISGLDTLFYPISEGMVAHNIVPGEPNLSPLDPQRQLEYYALSIDSTRQSTKDTVHAIVTGYIQRNSTFSTVSPEIPFLILRDPPGDLSYAELIDEETSETSLRFSTLMGGSVTTWAEATVGVEFEAGFLGISTESSTWGTVNGSLELGGYSASDTELIVSMTNKTAYRTDDSGDLKPELIGAAGDVFVGAALNILYAQADVLNYDEETCSTNQTIEAIMGTESIATQYAYTAFYIENSEIPRLENLLNFVPSDSIWWYENQINLWEQILARNDSLKMEADTSSLYNSTWSFSGGLAIDEEITKSTTETSNYEFQIEVDSEIAAEAGFEVAGSGASGGVIVNLRAEFGGGSTNRNLKSRTTSYHLEDDESTDGHFLVVKECPTYNTPIFEEIASFTSCPYIPGTNQRDKPVLIVDNPIRENADPALAQSFVFTLANNSESNETREYMIDIIDATNPNAAEISPPISGFPAALGPYSIPAFDPNNPEANQITQEIFINKVSASTNYSYENLTFVAYPKCESSDDYLEETSSTASVSIFFESPCSQITLDNAESVFPATAANNEVISIDMTDYDLSLLEFVQLEYRQIGFANWVTAVTLDDTEMGVTTTTVDWNIDQINDGEYTVRLRLFCGSGTTQSASVTGIIDRQGPIVFGIPSPIDDVYDMSENDVISIQYEEDIACQNGTVQLEDMVTGELFDAILSCVNNQAIITPVSILPTAAYRVILSGIEDVYANTTNEDYRWAFIVGDYQFDPNCDPVDIANNNINQDAISQSVYYAEEINSTGTVANASTIGFVAEDQISLDSGFEVRVGATFRASIDDCPH